LHDEVSMIDVKVLLLYLLLLVSHLHQARIVRIHDWARTDPKHGIS